MTEFGLVLGEKSLGEPSVRVDALHVLKYSAAEVKNQAKRALKNKHCTACRALTHLHHGWSHLTFTRLKTLFSNYEPKTISRYTIWAWVI